MAASACVISASSYEIESDCPGFLSPFAPPPVRAKLVEVWACSLILWFACAEGGCRDVPPAGHLLFLRRQEKKAKEGDPTVCVPCAALRGNLRCSRPAGSRSNSLRCASLRQSRALIRWPLCSSAHTEGMGEPNSRTAPRAIASLGPAHQRKCHAQGAAQPGSSAATTRMAFWVFTPCWLRLRRGGCGVAWAPVRPCFVI